MKKKVLSKNLRLAKGTCLLLQWGMAPIFLTLAAVFYSVTAEAELTVAEINRYGGMVEVLLASLLLLSFGAFVAEVALKYPGER